MSGKLIEQEVKLRGGRSQSFQVIKELNNALNDNKFCVNFIDTIVLVFKNKLVRNNNLSYSKLLSKKKLKNIKKIIIKKLIETTINYLSIDDKSKNDIKEYHKIKKLEAKVNSFITCIEEKEFHSLLKKMSSKDIKSFIHGYVYVKDDDYSYYRLMNKRSAYIKRNGIRVKGIIEKKLNILFEYNIFSIKKFYFEVKYHIYENSYIEFSNTNPDYQIKLILNDIIQKKVFIENSTYYEVIINAISLLTSLCFKKKYSPQYVRSLLTKYDKEKDRKNISIKISKLDICFNFNSYLSNVFLEIIKRDSYTYENSKYIKKKYIFYNKKQQLMDELNLLEDKISNIFYRLEIKYNSKALRQSFNYKFYHFKVNSANLFMKNFIKKIYDDLHYILRIGNLNQIRKVHNHIINYYRNLYDNINEVDYSDNEFWNNILIVDKYNNQVKKKVKEYIIKKIILLLIKSNRIEFIKISALNYKQCYLRHFNFFKLFNERDKITELDYHFIEKHENKDRRRLKWLKKQETKTISLLEKNTICKSDKDIAIKKRQISKLKRIREKITLIM